MVRGVTRLVCAKCCWVLSWWEVQWGGEEEMERKWSELVERRWSAWSGLWGDYVFLKADRTVAP